PLFGYCTEPPAFFTSLCDWTSRRYGWRCDPSWVCPAESVLNAVALAINALTAEGDAIVVQTPCYDNFPKLIANNHRRLIANELLRDNADFSIDFFGLRRAFEEGARTLLFCNPHNPTGRVWTTEELRRVADLCIEFDVLVISDDIHCDIFAPGQRYTPLAAVDDRLRTRSITCYAPGKTFNVASLKASAVMIPDETLRSCFRAYQERMGLPKLSVLSYEVCIAAYTYGDRYADELGAYIAGNAALVQDFLARELPQIRCTQPQGSFLMLWDCTALGLSGQALTGWFADHAQVAFSSGSSYGASLDRWVRVNLGCSRVLLERALRQIKAALDGLPRP
ncbi:MAG: aminotransferase class I/II-fold pyridoxal phosphate-dependent enzyme, partial [Oscillospiraceae bacterium]